MHADNAQVLDELPDASFRMIYIDPPFNTGKVQKRQSLTTVRSAQGSRIGFKGQSYETIRGKVTAYNDTFEDYWAFLEPRLEEAWRLLADDGTLYLHLDYRESHYAKVLLDALFGRDCFLNEIIWAYDYGARAKKKWLRGLLRRRRQSEASFPLTSGGTRSFPRQARRRPDTRLRSLKG